MEFPDRPTDRENPNSLSLEAAPPCAPEQRQRDRAEASIEGKHPHPLARSAKTPSSRAFLRAQARSRRSQTQAYAHTSPSPHHSLSPEAPLKHPLADFKPKKTTHPIKTDRISLE